MWIAMYNIHIETGSNAENNMRKHHGILNRINSVFLCLQHTTQKHTLAIENKHKK